MLKPFHHTDQPKWLYVIRYFILYFSAPFLLVFVPFFLILGIYFITLRRTTPELKYYSNELGQHNFDPNSIFWFIQISDTHFSNSQAKNYEDFDKLLPNSSLYLIYNCGHAAMMEHPDEFNVLMHDWLKKTHL